MLCKDTLTLHCTHILKACMVNVIPEAPSCALDLISTFLFQPSRKCDERRV